MQSEEVGMRLLVVEDTAKVARLLERGLNEEGFAVDVVASGSDAVWMATEHEYDAIVLDVRLGDIDGFEVCRRWAVGAGADVDRAGFGPGPDRRPGRRR
jgi:two-component system OmpR family response regulator